MLLGKDDSGKEYVVSGNDRKAYEGFIKELEKATKDSSRTITLDPSTAADLERYQPGILSSGGRLDGSLF